MTTSVKERIKAELNQAQTESKQRANRIGDILRAAASMTFEEVKEGSAELNVITRKSVAEILEELKEAPAETVVTDEVTTDISPEVVGAKSQPAGDVPAPTWRSLIINAIAIVRDRQGDWLQALKDYWQENATKVDQDMSEEYGDRYLKVRSFFQRVVEQMKTKATTPQATSGAGSQPVTIEVVDADEPVADMTPNVRLMDSEASH